MTIFRTATVAHFSLQTKEKGREMKKSVSLAIRCLTIILICTGCSTRQQRVSNAAPELMRASDQKTNGIPEDLMRNFTIVITLKNETMKEAIIRLMREEVQQSETDLAEVKQSGLDPVNDQFRNPFDDYNRHYFFLEDAVCWNELCPYDTDKSEVSVVVSFECDENGPITESINIVPAELMPNSENWRDFANIAEFTISDLTPSAGKLIINRLQYKWRLETNDGDLAD